MATQTPSGGNGSGRGFLVALIVTGLVGLLVMCVMGVLSAIEWIRDATAQDWVEPIVAMVFCAVMVAFVLSQTVFKNQLEEARKDISFGDLIRGFFSLIWRVLVSVVAAIIGGGMTFVITLQTTRLARQDGLLIPPDIWVTPEQAAYLGTILFFFLTMWRFGRR